MTGLFLAVAAAVLFAVKETFNKTAAKRTTIYIILWGTMLLSLPFYVIGIWIEGIPHVHPLFWLAIAANTPLLIAANLLLIRALQLSPLSLTLPLLSFTPLFMILTSWIMLGELPSAWGLIGIILIPLGAFLLNSKQLSKGLLEPFRALKKERGSLLILLVAFIWSITANGDKIAIQLSSTFFYLATITSAVVAILTAIIYTGGGTKAFSDFKKHFNILALVSVTNTVALVLQMIAIQKTLVPYVIAIKRAGLILGGIFFGALFFKEKDIRYKLAGGIVMLLGVLLILVFN